MARSVVCVAEVEFLPYGAIAFNGPPTFNGDARWLEIAVRKDGAPAPAILAAAGNLRVTPNDSLENYLTLPPAARPQIPHSAHAFQPPNPAASTARA